VNKEKLLQNILGVLSQVRDNKEKLQLIYDFFFEEIYEDEEDEEPIEIPKKYKSFIKDIAQSIDCGHICYINPRTMECIDIPIDVENAFMGDEENPFQNELDKTDTWEKVITIEPLESHESFEIMKRFVNKVPNEKLQNKLWNVLEHRKPFANFKNLIDNSDYRQDWFDFKQSCLEEHVFEILQIDGIFKN